MSILIKGMELPENCDNCDFMQAMGEYGEPVCMQGVFIECPTRRPPDCPLVPVQPHGRLIDADALSEKMVICSKHIPKDSFEWDLCGEVITQLALAPTIIEAEGGDAQ